MADRLPTKRTIRITVDSAHNFHYHDLFSGRDAGSLTVIKDDRIAWVLDSAIDPRTFQIDFGEINPFHIFRPATLRGRDHIVSEKVNFPAGFPGNRVLKYSVSLGNGLRDDPDVTPVESDPGQILHGLVVYGLALEPDCKIRWTSVYFVDISLNPPEIVKSLGGETKANVNWKWDIGSTDPMPEFDVHFPDTVPAGCLRDTHSQKWRGHHRRGLAGKNQVSDHHHQRGWRQPHIQRRISHHQPVTAPRNRPRSAIARSRGTW